VAGVACLCSYFPGEFTYSHDPNLHCKKSETGESNSV